MHVAICAYNNHQVQILLYPSRNLIHELVQLIQNVLLVHLWCHQDARRRLLGGLYPLQVGLWVHEDGGDPATQYSHFRHDPCKD